MSNSTSPHVVSQSLPQQTPDAERGAKVWQSLWQLPRRYELIASLVRRELAARYKGSVLGMLWMLITPIVMIAIFTFIFAGIFGARFGASSSPWDYAIYLYCGLLPWNAFQEAVQQSSTTIVSHANLVKRVVFPLETLPVVVSFVALASQAFGTVALLIATLLVRHELHLSVLWLPVLVLLQMVATIGVAWLVASLGVFLRDIVQGVTLVLTAWMFLTPIIYPETAVPQSYQFYVDLNPFTALIRSYRRIFLEGITPDFAGLWLFAFFALFCFVFGYWWFARTRKGFADVI